MNEMINTFSGALDKFTCKFLVCMRRTERYFSSQLSFYNYLPDRKLQKIRVTDSPVYNVLGGSGCIFNHDTGQIYRIDGNKFFRSIEIKDFCSETASGVLMCSSILMLTILLRIHIHPWANQKHWVPLNDAEKQLKEYRRWCGYSIAGTGKGKNDIVSGDISFGFATISR